jgi:methionine-rich copper-binding protein CopC
MKAKGLWVAGILTLVLATARFGSALETVRHLALVKSEPMADSTVTVAPTEIKLFWTEPPTLAATTVRITSAANAQITVGAAKADAKDQKIVSIPVTGQLTPGVYTVTWRTAGDDGHVLNGTYKFTFRAD